MTSPRPVPSFPLSVPPTDTEVDTWWAVLTAARAADLPGLPGPSRTEVAGRLRVPPARGRSLHWAAGDAGDEGVAELFLFEDGANDTTAALEELTVRPDARRRGVGTALWERVRAELQAAGRTSVEVMPDLGGPGQAFAESLGFTCVLPLAWYVQEVPEPPGPAADAPAGYRWVAWEGVVPDAWAAPAAAAHGAMADAPSGETDERVPSWDADRLRAAGQLILDRGGRFLTVAAVTAEGEVAAYTELVLPDPAATRALQYDTVVVPRHRGHGLGRAVKRRMLAEVASAYPGLRWIGTTVADENTPMRAVNEALGYRRERAAAVYRLKL
ncbi:GNAT family N-acetyltransferase [Streptomyces venezuelae]|uniref:GNAT family N-acetyltransferase n=1 Tax=Streptomyces venezuelae TaxID=54571 RepID=A0A5P2D545_STRVZ|nr:GNAT family N-acetyltransferase [Streptomyces venezuelae]QES49843.1 GNAT family N-acetyltransferase [Streptomyces venezuelae]